MQEVCFNNLVFSLKNHFNNNFFQFNFKKGDGGERYFEGFIDDVRIWNIPRTKEQIKQNMNQSLANPKNIEGLIGYWKCNE